MNIELTIAEAEYQLTNMFRSRIDTTSTDIEVKLVNSLSPREKPLFNIYDALTTVRVIENYHDENKIPAIKALRAYADRNGFGIGLAQAKWFVEDV